MRGAAPVPVPFETASALQLPLFSSYVRAGFPNPADDHLEAEIGLQVLLVRNPPAAFLLRVAGESMIGAGIYPEDLVVIDRSLSVQQRGVVAEVEGEFLIKRFCLSSPLSSFAIDHPPRPSLASPTTSSAVSP